MISHSKVKLPEKSITAWARLLRSSQHLINHTEAALKFNKLPPLSWYDALLELYREKQHGLRPFELQKSMLLTQYNMSRLIDRIVKEGYAERLHCDSDKRGQIICITKDGCALMKKMWPIYESAISQLFSDKLTSKEIDNLSNILSKIIT